MTADFASLLAAIDRLSAAVLSGIPAHKRLWTADGCAQYLGYSKSHFLQKIACRPDFPRPHQVGDGDKGRRWKASDVIDWVDGR